MADQKTFESDKEFLSRYRDIIQLQSGQSKILVCPSLQGRVFTSTADGDEGFSFGWINHDLVASGEILKHCNNWGGEDRFWLGPEGGQFSIFFPPGAKYELDDWQTPAPIDTDPWDLVHHDEKRAVFTREMSLLNTADNHLKAKTDREVLILNDQEIADELGAKLPSGMSSVGFKSINKLTNQNDFAWTKETGMLSIWILGQSISTDKNTIILPYEKSASGPLINEAYFGKIDAGRLKILDKVFLFKGDGKNRGKIGVGPNRTKSVIGSYDEENGVLTIVKFSFDPSKKDYVNSMWEHQEDPFCGDVVNSYNDGPLPGGSQMGPFYELETSSPAADIEPGDTLTHEHATFHFCGSKDALEQISRKLLGVGFEDCF
jgi:hypothetical protein